MREFVVMADVNTDPAPEYIEQEGITIFPQYYHFNDGVIYGDEKKLSSKEFYDRLKKGERAYSMGCNPETVRRMMEDELKKDHDILAIMASSACSGSYNTVLMESRELMEEYPGSKIIVIDTFLETVPAGMSVFMAQEMKKKGATLEDTAAEIEKHKLEFNVLFIVNDLKFLVRGGRLDPASGLVGTLLGIKPILTEGDGLITSHSKCRGKNTAKKNIIKELKEMNLDPEYFAVLHSADREEALEFAELLKQELGVTPKWISEISLIIGVHIGDGGVGVVYRKLPD